MKLIGSMAERKYREELMASNRVLNNSDEPLNNTLVKAGYEVKNSYVLNHIPEQCEDIYILLISGTFILTVETSKLDLTQKPLFEQTPLKQYLLGLSKRHQIQITVALDLASA
ncbi:hypothetical protein [Pseudoalteromonas sp. McH1-42]|uniref:hypothetical protein n=1 Tax=Pseudoalteromonas sp. McH1-42 TaxID=2917752 RepID=UPI001EF4BDC0|nr:hypothetical protein [Pseudoalteromonas sp. McH1-42]MCG7563022.1 hypothetical protein [Pseudoalteromonas sp. McH1-42]